MFVQSVMMICMREIQSIMICRTIVTYVCLVKKDFVHL